MSDVSRWGEVNGVSVTSLGHHCNPHPPLQPVQHQLTAGATTQNFQLVEELMSQQAIKLFKKTPLENIQRYTHVHVFAYANILAVHKLITRYYITHICLEWTKSLCCGQIYIALSISSVRLSQCIFRPILLT